VSLLLFTSFTLVAVGGGPENKGYAFLPIDNPDAGPFGTSVFGVNSSGVMVGNFGDTEDVIRGFVLRAGQWTTVTVGDSSGTSLNGVNSQGTAVGNFADDLGNSHGFTYAADGTITYLPDAAPGPFSAPQGINNQGAVVGVFWTQEMGFHGYSYEDGSFTYFDPPGSTYTWPTRISDSGTVCGYFIDAQDNAHGFLRDKKGTFTQIDVPGALQTQVFGMNDHGDFVGFYWDGTTGHGFLLRKGVSQTIDYPGATDTVALDINNAGDIVGTYNGFSRGFLATPSK
jgi:probable HAF family extracellular repeat protein